MYETSTPLSKTTTTTGKFFQIAPSKVEIAAAWKIMKFFLVSERYRPQKVKILTAWTVLIVFGFKGELQPWFPTKKVKKSAA